MVLEFYTENLNKRKYRNLFWNLCLHTNLDARWFLNHWRIRIIPLNGTDTQFFGHVRTTSGQTINTGIPSGVTGKNEITLWLNDTKNEFIDRSNIVVAMHEFCHARLFIKWGTAGGTWVKAVHDKIDYQGRILKSFPISYWYWSGWIWRKVLLNVIDINRDL